jgi:hypothetical protein
LPRGGPRPGSGRPKGTLKTNATQRQKILAEVLVSGLTPLEVMNETMRRLWLMAIEPNEDGSPNFDIEMAKEAVAVGQLAAPYVHARLATIEQRLDATIRRYAVADKPITAAEWERIADDWERAAPANDDLGPAVRPAASAG